MIARYQHRGMILVRMATDPGQVDLPQDLDLSDPDVIGHQGVTWLEKTWARGEVREALAVASPDLTARIPQLLCAGTATERDLRRAIVAVASYLLRWQRRVTPFGFFAGVIAADVGPALTDVEGRYQAVARADAEWIAALVGRLDQDRLLRTSLTVVADGTAVVRDGRLVVTRRPDPGARVPGPAGEISVRWTWPTPWSKTRPTCPPWTCSGPSLTAPVTWRTSARSGPT